MATESVAEATALQTLRGSVALDTRDVFGVRVLRHRFSSDPKAVMNFQLPKTYSIRGSNVPIRADIVIRRDPAFHPFR